MDYTERENYFSIYMRKKANSSQKHKKYGQANQLKNSMSLKPHIHQANIPHNQSIKSIKLNSSSSSITKKDNSFLSIFKKSIDNDRKIDMLQNRITNIIDMIDSFKHTFINENIKQQSKLNGSLSIDNILHKDNSMKEYTELNSQQLHKSKSTVSNSVAFDNMNKQFQMKQTPLYINNQKGSIKNGMSPSSYLNIPYKVNNNNNNCNSNASFATVNPPQIKSYIDKNYTNKHFTHKKTTTKDFDSILSYYKHLKKLDGKSNKKLLNTIFQGKNTNTNVSVVGINHSSYGNVHSTNNDNNSNNTCNKMIQGIKIKNFKNINKNTLTRTHSGFHKTTSNNNNCNNKCQSDRTLNSKNKKDAQPSLSTEHCNKKQKTKKEHK